MFASKKYVTLIREKIIINIEHFPHSMALIFIRVFISLIVTKQVFF